MTPEMDNAQYAASLRKQSDDIQRRWDQECAETAQYLSCAECGKLWTECVCEYGIHIAAAQEMTGSVARLTHDEGYLELEVFSHGKGSTIFVHDELFTSLAQAWLVYKAARDKEDSDAIEATWKRRRERPLADCQRMADAALADYYAIPCGGIERLYRLDVDKWAQEQIPTWRDQGHDDLWIARRKSLAYFCLEQCKYLSAAGIPETKWHHALVRLFKSDAVPEFLVEGYETTVRLMMATILEAPADNKEV